MATGASEADLVRAHLHALADRLQGAIHQLTGQLLDDVHGSIDEPPHDPPMRELLRLSIESNIANIARHLRGEIGDDVPVTAAAEEFARRLAQRDSPPGALLRAHRLLQIALLDWARDVTEELLPETGMALAAIRAFADTTFAYVGDVSEGMLAIHQQERDRWRAHRNTVMREAVVALLSEEVADVELAEQALGHRLRQHHLGVLLWTADGSLAAPGLNALEHHLHHLARTLHCEGHSLFVPHDRSLAWGWFSLGHQEPADLAERLAAVGPAPGISIAIGTPSAGAEGFRATHEEALEARRVAVLDAAEPATSTLTWYGDPGVRAAALLAVDLPRTRRMVRRTLRGLAADTETNARLRETLLVFLQARESYVTAAARLHLHKNTVRYRVERAVHLRGRPLDEDRLDLELALHACARLSSHVLVAHR